MTEQELIQLIDKMPENDELKKVYREAYKSLSIELKKWLKNTQR